MDPSPALGAGANTAEVAVLGQTRTSYSLRPTACRPRIVLLVGRYVGIMRLEPTTVLLAVPEC